MCSVRSETSSDFQGYALRSRSVKPTRIRSPKIMTKSANVPLERQLIQLVHQHPQLYDTGHEHYKDIEKRDKIWSEIAEELKLSMAQCKAKWRTLRDAFAKQYKLVQRSQISEDFSCVRFKNYEQLSFLKSFIKPRDPVITDEMIRSGNQDYHLNLTYNLLAGVSDDAILDETEKQHLLMNGDRNVDTNGSDNAKVENNFNGYANENRGTNNETSQYLEDSDEQDDLILYNEPQIMLTSSDTSITTKRRRTIHGNTLHTLKRKVAEEDPIVIFFRSMGDVARSYNTEIQSDLREKILGLMLEAETKNTKIKHKGNSNDSKNDKKS